MTPPLIVVYAEHRPFRVQCEAVLRRAGARVRLASRPAELAKAMREASGTVVIVGDEQQDAEVAGTLVATSSSPLTLILQRALGESIEEIVARALAVVTVSVDQPRSSE
jgi:hypothetical protein